MAIGRSKSNPGLDLQEAVGKASLLYHKDGRNSVHIRVATDHWGFSEKSSAGRRAVSALSQFGLVEEIGRGEDKEIKLTPLALDIITDERPDSRERLEKLQTTALSPSLYNQLWERSDHSMPSEGAIRDFCQRVHGFNPNGIREFVKNFTSTIEFAELAKNRILREEGDDKSADDPNGQVDTPPATSPFSEGRKPMPVTTAPDRTDFDLPIKLGTGLSGTLRLPNPMTSEEWRKLESAMEHLKQLKTFLVDDDLLKGEDEESGPEGT